jgi:uncharacterized protein YrrD
MRRFQDLRGMAAVDMQTAERIGEVDEFVIDPSRHRLAAVLVAVSRSLLDGTTHVVVPAAAIHSIGPDPLTVRRVAQTGVRDAAPQAEQDALPWVSHLVGRKVVSESGVLLGAVADVLLGETNDEIAGYALDTPAVGLLRVLGGRKNPPDYVRADPRERVGPDLLVVPDDAIVRAENAQDATGTAMPTGTGAEPPS